MKMVLRIVLMAGLCLMPVMAVAQNLLVYHVVGDATYVNNGRNEPLAMNMSIAPSTVINIPYEGKVELLDITEKNRITLSTPGRGSVTTMISDSRNIQNRVNERYIEYVKKQMTNTDLVSLKRFTDFATVTRAVAKSDDNDGVVNAKDDDHDAFFDGDDDDFFGDDDDWDLKGDYERYREKAIKNFEAYRQQAYRDYAEAVKQAWKEFDANPPVPEPKLREVEPVIRDAPVETDKWKVLEKVEKVARNVIHFAKNEIERMLGKRQPVPLRPDMPDEPDDADITEFPDSVVENYGIEEQTVPEEQVAFSDFAFTYYGTEMSVRLDESKRLFLKKVTPTNVGELLGDQLCTKYYNNTLIDCLDLRQKYNLSDWAYLQLLDTIATNFCGKGTDEAVLFTGFLLSQSGYKMKFASNPDDGDRLCLLIGSKHSIYNYNSLSDNDDYYYCYPLTNRVSRLSLCQANLPKTQSLSLYIHNAQQFGTDMSEVREIQSNVYPEMNMRVSVNRNLMRFYDSYPHSQLNNDFTTHWAILANTPLQDDIKKQIYPDLKAKLEGLSNYEKVARILNLVQVPNLKYVSDYDMWGVNDRALFPEETLGYPGSDCEDHAILFTRLVRDLTGLKCILIYYPNHLAAGVCLGDDVAGNAYIVEGERYVVTDPCISYAKPGEEMKARDLGIAELRIEDMRFILLDGK